MEKVSALEQKLLDLTRGQAYPYSAAWMIDTYKKVAGMVQKRDQRIWDFLAHIEHKTRQCGAWSPTEVYEEVVQELEKILMKPI